ncbi:PadR family transcriptional regulator [Cyclobacterium xiamenense]|nr:PadR family transcriptional regulator [Cyclobacterium xiamenense]
MNASNTQTKMRKGIVEFCVLHMVGRGGIYASDLIEELKDAQMIVIEGTLYPLLHRLKQEGLATYEQVESDVGPPKKYYSLTDKGHQFLNELQETWKNLNSAVNQLLSKPKNH